jgi:hypothetical protein
MWAINKNALVKIILSTILLSILSTETHGSHFRFGHFSWEGRPDISKNAVDFKLEVAYRWSYYGRPGVGTTFRPDAFYFGDGTSSSHYYEVIAINASEDWMIGRAVGTSGAPGVVQKTYASGVASNGLPWIAYIDSNARIGSLVNAANGRYRVEAKIDTTTYNRSPRTNIAPIVTCPRGACQFYIPAVDKDGDTIRFRIASSAESKISNPPTGLQIDADSGFIDWSNSSNVGIGLYAIQIIIEDLNEQGQMKSSVAVDFIINLQEFSQNNPPSFDVPPTPENNSTIVAIVGQPMSFDVHASDADSSDMVDIGHVGLPSGSTLADVEVSNTSRATFSWTPSLDDMGDHLITFTANDNKGSAALPQSIKISVVKPGISQVRVVDKISTIGIDPDLSSFSISPDRIEAFADYTEVEWRFLTFSKNQIESLSLDLVLADLQSGETKTVTHQVVVEYRDVNGELISQTLPEQTIQVGVTPFSLAVRSDKSFYTVDEVVEITSNVTNLGGLDYPAKVALKIVDINGNLVTDLGQFPTELVGGNQSFKFTGRNFSVGNTLTGTYQIQSMLLNDQDEIVETQLSDFRVVTNNGGDHNISSHVYTDKIQYQAWDQVSIKGLVSNLASNGYIENAVGHLDVRDPNGLSLFEQSIELGNLAPGTQLELPFPLTLRDQLSGMYSVSWTVLDDAGLLLASSQSTFAVVREASQSYGGEVTVANTLFYQDGENSCTFTLFNRSSTDDNDMSVRYEIYDMNSGLMTTQKLEFISLAANSQSVTEQSIAGDSLAIGSYACVLSIESAGQWINVDAAAFDLREPPVQIQTALEQSNQGRLLIMLDEPRECSVLTSIHSRFTWGNGFNSTDSIRIRIYDEDDQLVDEEYVTEWDVKHNAATSGSEADLSVQISKSGEIEVWVQDNHHGLKDKYRVELDYKKNIFVTNRHSWNLESHCDRPLKIGEILDDIHLLGFDMNIADDSNVVNLDPYGPESAPSVTEQQQYLVELLDAEGLQYTIVHSSDEFTSAMRARDYFAYAILSERPHLSLIAQKELREEIHAGKGLIVGGSHDKRNFILESALGLAVTGRHQWATGLKGRSGEEIASFDSNYWVQMFSSLGAETRNNYLLKSDASSSGLVNLIKDSAWFNSIENYKKKAVTVHEYGNGLAVFFGFDVLAVATELENPNTIADLLVTGLSEITNHLQPIATAYREWPMTISIDNQRADAQVTSTITLPADVELMVNPYYQKTGELWVMNLDMVRGQTFNETVYIALPNHLDTLDVQLFTKAVGEKTGEDAKAESVVINLMPLALFEALVDESYTVKHKYWYAPKFYGVYADVLLAKKAIENNNLELARFWLLTATNKLLDDDREDVIALRLSMDEQVRIFSKKI